MEKFYIATYMRSDGAAPPVILSEEGCAGVSERISRCANRGTGHVFRILRSFRSLTPTRLRSG
jgi:hypothetical protein